MRRSPSPRTARCGAGLAAWRLLRCHPFTRGRLDPVPPATSGPVEPAAAQQTTAVFPTNHYHRRAAARGLPLQRQEVSFARNSESQSSIAGVRRRWWRRYALHHGLHAACYWPLSSATNTFYKPKPVSSRPRRPSRRPALRRVRPRLPQPPRRAASQRLRFRTGALGHTFDHAAIAATLETDTTVENEFYKIVFTNRGAQVKHWILKKYFDSAGKPLDLVQPQAAARFGLPLSLFTYEPALTAELNSALYQMKLRRRATLGHRPAAGSDGNYFPIRGQRRRCGEDFSLRFELRDRHRNRGEAQRRAGACAGAVAGRPRRHGGVLHQSSMLRGQMPTPSFFAWSIDGKDDRRPPPR